MNRINISLTWSIWIIPQTDHDPFKPNRSFWHTCALSVVHNNCLWFAFYDHSHDYCLLIPGLTVFQKWISTLFNDNVRNSVIASNINIVLNMVLHVYYHYEGEFRCTTTPMIKRIVPSASMFFLIVCSCYIIILCRNISNDCKIRPLFCIICYFDVPREGS